MTNDPYILAIGSHKGGTGRTTAALALAWLWGQLGSRVTLADCDPVRAAGLVALEDGTCPWPNVRYVVGLPHRGEAGHDADLIVIDCPSLMDQNAVLLLRRADTIVLTVLADPISLRTIPAAAAVLAAARVSNPRLDLLGVLLAIYNEGDPLQPPMLERLRQMHGELLLEPPVPYDRAVRDWPLSPGADLPVGPAADAYAALADRLTGQIPRLAAASGGGG